MTRQRKTTRRRQQTVSYYIVNANIVFRWRGGVPTYYYYYYYTLSLSRRLRAIAGLRRSSVRLTTTNAKKRRPPPDRKTESVTTGCGTSAQQLRGVRLKVVLTARCTYVHVYNIIFKRKELENTTTNHKLCSPSFVLYTIVSSADCYRNFVIFSTLSQRKPAHVLVGENGLQRARVSGHRNPPVAAVGG